MRSWVKLGFAAFLLGLLLTYVDWQLALARLTAADPLHTAAAVGIGMAGLLAAALRWRRVVEGSGTSLPVGAAIRIHWAGVFWNQFLPTGFGGDVVRFALGRRFIRASVVAASIMVERLTGLVVVLALAWVAGTGWAARLGASVAEISHTVVAMASVAIAGVILALVIGVTWVGSREGRHKAWLHRLPFTLRERIEALAEAVSTYLNRPRVLIDAAVMSVPCHLASILAQYLTLKAVGAPVGFAEVAMVAPLMPLIALMPLTPNGIGLTEAAIVALYVPLGVPPEVALAAAALRRLTDLVAASGGALTWLLATGSIGAPSASRHAARPYENA
jgi:uncharacterized protein (TIRG00374 family)